jgi:hypothetical protein
MKTEKAVAMPFNWIFAIVVGAFILFLAIFAAVRLMGTGGEISSTITASKFESLFDPLETGLYTTGKAIPVKFKRDSRTFYECSYLDNRPFGKQTIAFTEKIFDRYGEAGEAIRVSDKYIFTEDMLEGKTYYAFSQPFYLGYKVADSVIITAGDYCFYQAPEKINNTITRLGLKNVYFTEDLNSCQGISVCFSESVSCDINVEGMCDANCEDEYEYGKVRKKGESLYFIEGLMYSAIFSSPEIYECNIKRLMNKFSELASVYIRKIDIIERKGCSSNIKGQLIRMQNKSLSLENSRGLLQLWEESQQMEIANQAVKSNCRLY